MVNIITKEDILKVLKYCIKNFNSIQWTDENVFVNYLWTKTATVQGIKVFIRGDHYSSGEYYEIFGIKCDGNSVFISTSDYNTDHKYYINKLSNLIGEDKINYSSEVIDLKRKIKDLF